MYWYYKVLFSLVVVVFLGGLVYAVRGFLPDVPAWFADDSEEVGVVDPGTTGVVPPPPPPATTDDRTDTPKARPADALPTDPFSLQVADKLQLARQHVTNDEVLVARKILEELIRNTKLEKFSPYWMKTAELLGAINTQIVFSDIPAPEKVSHIIKRGDNIWDIAKQYDVTQTMIMRANGIDPESPRIYPGQVLHIYDAEWAIEVSKKHHLLILKDGPTLFRIYHIGIGKQDRTPVGRFKIVTKESEPIWTDVRAGQKYPYGHPNNVLGTRWMGVQAIGDTSPLLEGYGIHGTWEPESIGQARSNGCIRMLNEQVEQLYDIVPYGTQVVIYE